MEKRNKIRILYLIDGLYPGGKERQFIEILKYLNRDEYHIGIITFNKALFYQEEAKRLADYFVEIDKKEGKFKPFFRIGKYFKEFKPDIVHTWDYLSSMYGYVPTKRYKAHFINNSIQDVGVDKGITRMLKVLMLKLSDIPMSNSITGLQNYGFGYGEYIYNAVNIDRFEERKESDKFSMIMVANFSDYKDHVCFVKAAIQLVRNKVVDQVYLAGEGKNKQKCIDIVKAEGDDIYTKFDFLGAIKNVEHYLSFCNVGVLCSTKKYGEGISNSILEYMASGVVAVATNIGATWEIIEDNKNGMLFNEGAVNELVDKVKTLKNNPELCNQLSEAAYKTVTTKFDYARNINKLDNIYKSI